jgi:RNA polymerase-associated protein
MAVAANKRSVMTLFSGPTDIYSHQVRIVLAEKGVSFEIEHVEKDNPPQDLIDLNPNQSVPTLWIVSSLCGNPASLWNTWMSVSRIRR